MTLLKGDCLEILKTLDSNSVDSLITDPPAGIAFMNKHWDKDRGGRDEWIAWMQSVMTEALRVLKPGSHGLVWALPRTSHWTATALENAGFEIRDIVNHLFGTGFPKSHNLEKSTEGLVKGFGTALKPACEHWVLVRKPCAEKTVAANVIKYGTGGLNIDGCRIGVASDDPNKRQSTGGYASEEPQATVPNAPYNKTRDATLTTGRFPANLVLDEEAASLLDEQSGELVSKWGKPSGKSTNSIFFGKNVEGTDLSTEKFIGDTGGASRFFYCAKVSTAERNAGLEDFPLVRIKGQPSFLDEGGYGKSTGKPNKPIESRNHHPTVKSIKLMSYLCRLITPPKGIVLDPFMGSGSTGIAAKKEGFDFIGIEQEQEYFDIAEKRVALK